MKNKVVILNNLLLVLISCARQKMPEAPCPIQQPVVLLRAERVMITIFVHGTRIFPKFKAQEAYYTVPGMAKVADLDASFTNLHRMADLLIAGDPKKFSHDTFYAFGWSGKLSFQTRRAEAHDLYAAILELLDLYEWQHGFRPGVRLITHSHGGNVALNLAAVKDPSHPLVVDELILLACPVQDATKHLINDSMFIKRYALVSSIDLLQIVDPQGWQCDHAQRVFSERYFTNYPGVVQVTCKKNGRPLFHLEFILGGFVRRLPEVLAMMDCWYNEMMNNADQSQGWVIPGINLCSKTIKISKISGCRRILTKGCQLYCLPASCFYVTLNNDRSAVPHFMKE